MFTIQFLHIFTLYTQSFTTKKPNQESEFPHKHYMDQNHVITIDRELEIMNKQVEESLAGNDSCCIFKVPKSLLEINKEAYRPRIVSIGPYHYGNNDLEMIQRHKWRYLHDLIQRTSKSFEFFLNIIASLENSIRQSYSDPIDRFSTIDLAKMMVLDGFFLIELFRKVGKLVPIHKNDPIYRMVWVSPFLRRDLLSIENQIPFFVLQKLFDESKTNDNRTLPSLILEFFNYAVDRPKEVLNEYENLEGKHLLDFFRESFINTQNKSLATSVTDNEKWRNTSHKRIQPATKLVISGVKFKAIHKPSSFLDIKFRNGVLYIPQINIDDFYSSFFMNCVAFEQCYHHCSKHITTYVVFMGCLMNNSTDVGLLSECKIIENYFGTDKEIAKFFKNVGKDVTFDVTNNYLLGLFMEVNNYCKNGWHLGWAGLKYTYFEKPWSFISAFAAFTLLSLAALQTFYTVFPYYHKRD